MADRKRNKFNVPFEKSSTYIYNEQGDSIQKYQSEARKRCTPKNHSGKQYAAICFVSKIENTKRITATTKKTTTTITYIRNA